MISQYNTRFVFRSNEVEEQTEMAMIEVGLLTGYNADTESLDKVCWKEVCTSKPIVFHCCVNL